MTGMLLFTKFIPCCFNDKSDTPLGKSSKNKTRKQRIVGDNSMLNNINTYGLSKFEEVEALNYPVPTSSDIVD